MAHRFLITSATGNIGSALCLYLAKKGHDLIITARCLNKLQELSQTITTLYPQCKVSYCCADLGLVNTMDGLIEHAKKDGLDGIILIPPRPPVLPADIDLQVDILKQAMQDCLIGPRYLLQQLLPNLAASSLKSVILLSGASSKQPILDTNFEAFNIIRTAWVACFKTFAETYGQQEIRFNTISPGQVMTPEYTNKLAQEAQARGTFFTEVLRERTAAAPLRKLATVDGVIKTIYYFLESSGAREITATNVLIDGGASRSYC